VAEEAVEEIALLDESTDGLLGKRTEAEEGGELLETDEGTAMFTLELVLVLPAYVVGEKPDMIVEKVDAPVVYTAGHTATLTVTTCAGSGVSSRTQWTSKLTRTILCHSNW
jgi:hypothetical protein